MRFDPRVWSLQGGAFSILINHESTHAYVILDELEEELEVQAYQ